MSNANTQNYYNIKFQASCFLLILTLSACHHPKTINTSFYFWKTVFKTKKTESAWLQHFKVKSLYVRIMDIDMVENRSEPTPILPILFKNKIPDSVKIIPVVFIVNDVLKSLTDTGISALANKILPFVQAKVEQAGKSDFEELQIDCDWTASTREHFFYLLKQLKKHPMMRHKKLSVTLRLHQLKNQVKSGSPPADAAMLMCYNMGNLRAYGNQNSILEMSELKKYLNQNIGAYPMPLAIGLPLFNWAVAFRNKEYIGISKKIKFVDLIDKNQFIFIGDNIYKAATDLPDFGLNKADEIRWEAISMDDLQAVATYLSPLIKANTLTVIYFHLDENLLKPYHYTDLEKVNQILH